MLIEMLPHQADIVEDIVTEILVLEGGLGSGKTTTALLKMLTLAREYPGVDGLWIEPTHNMIGSILIRACSEWNAKAEESGYDDVIFEYRTSYKGLHNVLLIAPRTPHEVIVHLRSGENPERIAGFKVGWAILDEIDQLSEEVYNRARQRLRDSRCKVCQLVAVGTPEPGFNWTHIAFHEKKESNVRLISGISTKANTYNPDGYADSMVRGLDDDEKNRVLLGQRSALGGRVYRRFDRHRHLRECKNPFDGTLFVGADFNVGAMAWVVGRFLGDEIHIWGELLTADTDTVDQSQKMKALIERKMTTTNYKLRTAQQVVAKCSLVPDASCRARKTSSQFGMTDIDHLVKDGWDVRCPLQNPPVSDRIFSVNNGFHVDKIFIDPSCVNVIATLEQQTRDKHGAPDKGKGLDHFADALGYPVFFFAPSYHRRGNAA